LNLRRRASLAAVAGFAAATFAGRAAACDICAIYTATEQSAARPGLRIGVAEQLSRSTTIKVDGQTIDNVAEQSLTSSITQVFAGYGVSRRFALQLNLPIISRTFRRVEAGEIEHGDETGIGDLSLLGTFLVYDAVTENSVFLFSVLGGIKFPTGSPDRLKEELDENPGSAEEEGGHALRVAHTSDQGGQHDDEVASGIHGHDLALGSGSYDGIVGGQIFWSWKRLFMAAAAQYAIRTEGSFGYEYANDLNWTGGPGAYLWLAHGSTLGAQLLVSGETKGLDNLNGVKADDTGITALYLGPGFNYTLGTSLTADIVADIPVFQHNTALQIVPDFRLRGGITWRF
jgi:hypothetical protein